MIPIVLIYLPERFVKCAANSFNCIFPYTMKQSIIEYFSGHDGFKCGYCKKPNSNYSYGMWAHMMSVQDYQDLIDRGWRRSGKYCYKPLLDVTCCPMYTIRCRALEFKSSKSQKKVLKKFNKFLMGQEAENGNEKRKSSSCEDMMLEMECREPYIENKKVCTHINFEDVNIPFIDDVACSGKDVVSESTSKQNVPSDASQQNAVKQDCVGPDPTKAPCKKAKQARRERMIEKLIKKGVDISKINNNNKNKEKQIEDFINVLPNSVKRKLAIKLVRTNPPSAEWRASYRDTYNLYVKYQTVIHGDTPEKCSELQFHGFLVESPLTEDYPEWGPPCGYGSFHQQYWLDGKLIAVGVLDILPKCVSSVYFFYDPQYMNLALGTYGALREIAFTRRLQSMCSQLKYYYLGFYIHSCHKMRYKGQFHPSDLLCPETFKWFPLKDCIPKLEAAPYSRLDPDLDSIDENLPTDNDMNYMSVMCKGDVLLYKSYRRKMIDIIENMDDVDEYARLVGAKTVKRMILIRKCC